MQAKGRGMAIIAGGLWAMSIIQLLMFFLAGKI